jgi:hypothetical protein
MKDGKMTNSTKIIFIIWLTLLLAACGVQSTRKFQATEIPTETKEPTITNFPIKTLRPIKTMGPDSATLFAMKTQSELYWEATLPARGVVCDEEFQVDRYQGFIGLTTDDWWIYSCVTEDNDYSRRYTIIMRSDSSQSWRLLHNNFSWAKGEIAGFFPYRWTSDDHSVYLVPVTRSGCGFDPWGFFADDIALYRLDLVSGELEVVLPDSSGWYAFSSSPDDRYLAYSKLDFGNEVYIRDLYTGDEFVVELGNNYSIAGIFTWTFDSSQVIFAAGLEGWEDDEAGISLFLLDIPRLHAQELLNNDKRLLIPYGSWEVEENWLEENVLSMLSLDLQSRSSWSGWSIDINTGQVLEPTLTPTPTTSP